MTVALVAVAASLALAVWLGLKAGGSYELTRLSQAFETGLDQADWPAKHFEQMGGRLSPSLEPSYRAALAYLFAHRFRALNKRDESLMFLRTAAADAEAGSALRRLAEEELAAAQ